MIRGLFFDIDGTLCSFSTHDIPLSAVKALEKAKENGVKVFISTGRPPSIINNISKISHLIDGYITTNGAFCYIGNTIVYQRSISSCDIEALLNDAKEYSYPCLVATDLELAVYNEPREIVDRIFRKELGVTNLDLQKPAKEVLSRNVLQFTSFFVSSHDELLMTKLSNCMSARWHPAFIDITAIGADKGCGLVEIARFMGFDLSETMAFGDGENDIPILKKAGIGVAMGNSATNVKIAADFTTSSVDDGGVFKALRHFGVI